MPSVGKYIYELKKEDLTTVITNAYSLGTRIDLTIPQDPVPNNGLKGSLGAIKIIGAVKDVAAKTMDVIVTYNQSGSDVLLGQETATITDAPTGGGWGFHIDYRSLILTYPKDHPEGTVSIFMRTNNATATVNDVHFIWES